MERHNISGNSPYEPTVGFSRAVKSRPVRVGGGNGCDRRQWQDCRRGRHVRASRANAGRTSARALEQAGASFRDVVRTRTFVTDISRWEQAAKAHGEIFRDIRPAASMIGVTALVAPEMLVEIEVDAIIASEMK